MRATDLFGLIPIARDAPCVVCSVGIAEWKWRLLVPALVQLRRWGRHYESETPALQDLDKAVFANHGLVLLDPVLAGVTGIRKGHTKPQYRHLGFILQDHLEFSQNFIHARKLGTLIFRQALDTPFHVHMCWKLHRDLVAGGGDGFVRSIVI
jgi:hypothetical protein